MAVRAALFRSAAVMVLGGALLPASAIAQEANAAGVATADSQDMDEVVITTRRQAIADAVERKREAESSIDSVVADDAGKLPENSVTEVLQRVPGVTISRFAFTDYWVVEGSGVQVRGLTGVAARLNGRETFSANGTGGLSWGDVTPELMAAVDVYKSSTADLIEGGTGGQIDLRTKMPFDFNDGFAINGSAQANYGDMSEEVSPSGSVLLTNRWNTEHGEFGALIDLAASEYYAKSNFFRMEPYNRVLLQDGDAFIPAGFTYGFEEQRNRRKGIYAAFQWSPTDSLELSQTAFYSRRENEGGSTGVFATSTQGFWGFSDWGGGNQYHGHYGEGGTNALAVDPTVSVFDENRALISAPAVFTRNPNTWQSDGQIKAGGNTNWSHSENWTRDLTTSFKWDANERLALRGAAQFVRSRIDRKGNDIFPSILLPGSYSLDLSGDLPQVEFSDTSALADAANYSWYAHMPNLTRNYGEGEAFNLDATIKFSEEGFFKSLQAGARYAQRDESDSGYYGWTNLCAGWDGCDPNLPENRFSAADPADVQFQSFSNFFRGDANLPTAVWMPSFALAQQLSPETVVDLYGVTPTDPNVIAHNAWLFNPVADSLSQSSNNKAAYVMLRFGGKWGWEFDGNVGVRAVRYSNESTGLFDQRGLHTEQQILDANGLPVPDPNNPGSFLTQRLPIPGMPVTNPQDGVTENYGTSTATRALPAVNFRFKPSDKYIVRAGYNKTMDQPTLSDTRANGSLTAEFTSATDQTTGLQTLNFDRYVFTTGNPRLKPQYAENADLSFEWYPSRGVSGHASIFWRQIDNYLVYGLSRKQVGIILDDGSQGFVDADAYETLNSELPATIKGIELAGRMFFDKLPEPFNHFGVDASYTYIDSKAPGDRWLDIDGGEHTDLPVRGLSENSANVSLMYESKDLSVRLGWNWRTEYLMGANGVGTGGGYTYLGGPAGSPNYGFNQNITYGLPVYADDYYQVDFGVGYRATEKLEFSMNISNLLDATARSIMKGYPNLATGEYDQGHFRSWYLSDRRIEFGVRFSL